MNMMLIDTMLERLAEVAEDAAWERHHDWTPKTWTPQDPQPGAPAARIYLSRGLSRGRQQDVGYIEIGHDGDVTWSAVRARSVVGYCADAVRRELAAKTS